MARIRSIKPEFWTSEQVLECSPITRLMFVGMWNFADDCGRLPMSPKSIKAQIFPSDDISLDTIRGMIQELSANGLVLIYAVDDKEYLQITGWAHQRIDKPQPAKYPAPIAEHSKNDQRTIPPDRIGEDKIGEDRREREKETRASALLSFDIFWDVWPNKVGKPAAQRSLKTALNRAPLSEILAGVQNYIRSKPPDRPWLNPATFLNQDRWKDRPAPTTGPQLTEHQHRRLETQDILHDLDKFSRNGSAGSEANPGVLPGDSGGEPESLRGGTGGNLIELSSSSVATRR